MRGETAGMASEALAEGERRLPYFFAHGSAVLCPACAEDAPEPERLSAIYTASRLFRCGACHVWIGPANDEEAERA